MIGGRPASAPRGTGFLLTAGMLCMLLVLVSQAPFLEGPRSAMRGVLAPAEAAATSVESGAGGALSVFGDIRGLRDQNQRLSAENARLRGEVAKLQAAAAENDALRRELAFDRGFGHRVLTAGVIGRGPDAFSRTLTIDRGSADGVRPGMVVLTGAGLVGRVREAASHSASIQTVADPLTRVNVYLAGAQLEGTVSGGTGPLRMDLVPKAGVVVAKGDWALTSGLGAGYPRGIPVGQVTYYARNDAAVSTYADLAWANDLGSIASVQVVLDFVPR